MTRTISIAIGALAVLLVLLGHARPAAADNVDQLVKQLDTGSDYKVRLSAATSLAKLGDARAIPAFIKALGKDSDKTVRAAAALGLSKIITADTPADKRDAAIKALEKASTGDKDAFVKKQAKKALDKLKKLKSGGGATAGAAVAGGIYIDIGEMSAKVADAAAVKTLMRKTVEKTFSKHAKDMSTKWTGGKAPTKKQLDAAKTQAYHVDGTIVEMTTKASGSSTNVSCKVSMLIATFPEKSMFGFLEGGATVQASSDPSDVALAKEDCVVAVVEDLVIKKIIPTIKTKSGI
jgi:hypothetical protein